MSIFKTVLILAAVAATVSAGPGGRWGRKGRRFNQRGRTQPDAAVADAADTPEAEENHAALSDALAAASEAAEAFSPANPLPDAEVADAGDALVDNIAEAVDIAALAPQAQEVQADVVFLRRQEAFSELKLNLYFAKKYQRLLSALGAVLSTDEVIEYTANLHKHLELAYFFAQENYKNIEQEGAALTAR